MKILDKLKDNIYIGTYEDSDRKELESFVKTIKTPGFSGFISLWTRFHNWDNESAEVYLLREGREGNIVGFHAVTFNKRNPYLNTYYIAVDYSLQGRGIGSVFLDYTMDVAREKGNTRYCCAAKIDRDGHKFYTKLGLVPIAIDNKTKEVKYDIDITNFRSIKEIKELDSNLVNNKPHKSRLNSYKRWGIVNENIQLED